MAISLEETLTDLWRQVLVEYADVVVLGTKRFPIRLTPKRRLREVDFEFEGNAIRGLEQPRNEIPVGANGAGRREGDAIPQRGSIRGECGRWEGDLI